MKFVFFPPKGLAELNAGLADLTRLYKGDGLKAVKSMARSLCSQLSNWTFPWDAKYLGKMSNAGIADTLRVIATPKSVYWRLRREDPKKAEQWQGIEGKGKGGQGRLIAFLNTTSLAGIQLTNKPTYSMVEPFRKTKRRRVVIRNPRYLAMNKTGVDPVINSKHRRIGRAASGWAWAQKDIGGTAKFEKGKQRQQHKTRTGRAVIWRSFGKVGLTIYNDNPHIRGNLPPFYEQRAISSTARLMKKQVEDAYANINARKARARAR